MGRRLLQSIQSSEDMASTVHSARLLFCDIETTSTDLPRRGVKLYRKSIFNLIPHGQVESTAVCTAANLDDDCNSCTFDQTDVQNARLEQLPEVELLRAQKSLHFVSAQIHRSSAVDVFPP
ncbi:hypothetical protein ECG_01840 [Echinococcus granulosus]|uniref:Exonuclease domain-containing protein n=1 Tax=Echinococcus granulosus TaxID=6210 RepID=A0A068W7G8_ECHGR|nr:hypothetical protein ECG_01840 [Echinococcus granulosus]CDS15209.1 hypothetical protein EgrG_002014800 [Echinococcus granulosus]